MSLETSLSHIYLPLLIFFSFSFVNIFKWNKKCLRKFHIDVNRCNKFLLWYFKTSNYWKLIAKSIFESMLMFTKCSSNSALNIERTLNVFIYSDRTRTPNFCLRTNGHRTSNIVRPITTVFTWFFNDQFLEKHLSHISHWVVE